MNPFSSYNVSGDFVLNRLKRKEDKNDFHNIYYVNRPSYMNRSKWPDNRSCDSTKINTYDNNYYFRQYKKNYDGRFSKCESSFISEGSESENRAKGDILSKVAAKDIELSKKDKWSSQNQKILNIFPSLSKPSSQIVLEKPTFMGTTISNSMEEKNKITSDEVLKHYNLESSQKETSSDKFTQCEGPLMVTNVSKEVQCWGDPKTPIKKNDPKSFVTIKNPSNKLVGRKNVDISKIAVEKDSPIRKSRTKPTLPTSMADYSKIRINTPNSIACNTSYRKRQTKEIDNDSNKFVSRKVEASHKKNDIESLPGHNFYRTNTTTENSVCENLPTFLKDGSISVHKASVAKSLPPQSEPPLERCDRSTDHITKMMSFFNEAENLSPSTFPGNRFHSKDAPSREMPLPCTSKGCRDCASQPSSNSWTNHYIEGPSTIKKHSAPQPSFPGVSNHMSCHPFYQRNAPSCRCSSCSTSRDSDSSVSLFFKLKSAFITAINKIYASIFAPE